MNLTTLDPNTARLFVATRPLDFVSAVAHSRLGGTARVMQALYLYACLAKRGGLARELETFLKEILEIDGGLNKPSTAAESEACSVLFKTLHADKTYGRAMRRLVDHEPILYMSLSIEPDSDDADAG